MANFQAINDNTGYDFIAGFHGIPAHWCWHDAGAIDTSEQFPGQNFYAFLPWHRAYLKWFEDHLLDKNPNIALPWWDWTSASSHRDGIPGAYNQQNVDGGPNPLYNFKSRTLQYTLDPSLDDGTTLGNGITFRHPNPPNGPPFGLPTSADVSKVFQISDFGAFSSQLELIHNQVHGWCNGSMGSVPTAAFDPVFWAHHCNIDRLWAIWQTKHGNNLPPGLEDLILAPFPYRAKDVLKIYDLGYEYAASGAEVKF